MSIRDFKSPREEVSTRGDTLITPINICTYNDFYREL
jgi:hypothetical protein